MIKVINISYFTYMLKIITAYDMIKVIISSYFIYLIISITPLYCIYKIKVIPPL